MYIDSKGKATLMVTPLILDEETGEVRLTEFKADPKKFRLWVAFILAMMIVPMVYMYIFG